MSYKLQSLLRAFIGDRRGNIAITFAISVIPIMFMSGIALDYSMIQRERWQLQQSADSSALYAVKEFEKAGKTESDLKFDAEDVVSSNFTIDGKVEIALDKEANVLRVRLTKDYQPAFLQLAHSGPVTIGVVAEAAYGGSTPAPSASCR